jgi:hypothetical protein
MKKIIILLLLLYPFFGITNKKEQKTFILINEGEHRGHTNLIMQNGKHINIKVIGQDIVDNEMYSIFTEISKYKLDNIGYFMVTKGKSTIVLYNNVFEIECGYNGDNYIKHNVMEFNCVDEFTKYDDDDILVKMVNVAIEKEKRVNYIKLKVEDPSAITNGRQAETLIENDEKNL